MYGSLCLYLFLSSGIYCRVLVVGCLSSSVYHRVFTVEWLSSVFAIKCFPSGVSLQMFGCWVITVGCLVIRWLSLDVSCRVFSVGCLLLGIFHQVFVVECLPSGVCCRVFVIGCFSSRIFCWVFVVNYFSSGFCHRMFGVGYLLLSVCHRVFFVDCFSSIVFCRVFVVSYFPLSVCHRVFVIGYLSMGIYHRVFSIRCLSSSFVSWIFRVCNFPEAILCWFLCSWSCPRINLVAVMDYVCFSFEKDVDTLLLLLWLMLYMLSLIFLNVLWFLVAYVRLWSWHMLFMSLYYHYWFTLVIWLWCIERPCFCVVHVVTLRSRCLLGEVGFHMSDWGHED